jgi:hypothetical protein
VRIVEVAATAPSTKHTISAEACRGWPPARPGRGSVFIVPSADYEGAPPHRCHPRACPEDPGCSGDYGEDGQLRCHLEAHSPPELAAPWVLGTRPRMTPLGGLALRFGHGCLRATSHLLVMTAQAVIHDKPRQIWCCDERGRGRIEVRLDTVSASRCRGWPPLRASAARTRRRSGFYSSADGAPRRHHPTGVILGLVRTSPRMTPVGVVGSWAWSNLRAAPPTFSS